MRAESFESVPRAEIESIGHAATETTQVEAPPAVIVASSAPTEVKQATTEIEPAATQDTFISEPSIAQEPLPVFAQVAEPAPVLPIDIPSTPTGVSSPRQAPQPLDLDQALAESGLILVRTAAATQDALVETPPVKLGRPRRARPQLAGSDEPLIVVETQK